MFSGACLSVIDEDSDPVSCESQPVVGGLCLYISSSQPVGQDPFGGSNDPFTRVT